MQEYIIDGEKYRYTGKYWVDSHWTVAPLSFTNKLNKMMSENIDFDSMSHEELIQFGATVKENDNPSLAIKCFDKILADNPEVNIIKNILPRYTSALREKGQAKEAILFGEGYISNFGKAVESSALYTSIAAAYIDIGDLVIGRKKANKAKAMMGGGSCEELMNVYLRLKSLEKKLPNKQY